MRALSRLRDGLVGAWCPSVSGWGGNVLRDLSSFGDAHGLLTNMDPATDWITSNGYLGLDFDGTNDYVQCSDHSFGYLQNNLPERMPRDAGCVSIWFSATFGRTNGLFGNLDGPGNRYAVWMDSSNSIYFDTLSSVLGTERLIVSGLGWTNDQLYHLVCSSGRGTGMRVYRDGVLAGSNSGNPVVTPPDNIWIGAVRPSTFQLLGRIFEVRVWNRPFDAQEIRTLYNGGPGFGLRPERTRRYVQSQTFTAARLRRQSLIGSGVY